MTFFETIKKGAGAEIFYKPEPEPHKNGPAPQHWSQPCNPIDHALTYIMKVVALPSEKMLLVTDAS
jgi:hypothetical protein